MCKHSTYSMLIGPRGCGKSSLFSAVLDDVQRKRARSAAAALLPSHASDRSFWVVKLQGSAVGTDAQAFREIATQLSIGEELHQQQRMLQKDDVLACGKEKRCRSKHERVLVMRS